MIKTYLLVLVLGLWTASCPASAPLRVACIGDSITYGVNLPPDQTYPADLQKMLGPKAEVKTFAFPGLSLLALPNGNPPYHPAYVGTAYYKQALQFNPNIVIIMLGTNDGSFTFGPGQSWPQVYGQRFTQQYKALIQSFRQLPAHPQVFVATCPTVFGTNQYAISPVIVNETVVPYIVKIGTAAHAPVIDVHGATAAYPADFGDKVHASPHGAFVIAHEVYSFLRTHAKTAMQADQQHFSSSIEEVLETPSHLVFNIVSIITHRV